MALQPLGNSNLKFAAIGIGCNRFVDTNDKEAVAAVDKALELDVGHFDTAESYGNGAGEEFLGEVLRGRRDQAFIASKFGMRAGPNGREIYGDAARVKDACDRSLKRLQTDYIDLYYQHRVVTDMPIEETWGAMKELVEAGKVLSLGISRATPEQLRQAHAVHPISALQSQYSLFTREEEASTLPVCQELGITFVAYGPLAFSFLGGAITGINSFPKSDNYRRRMPRFQDENVEHNRTLLTSLKEVASEVGASMAQVAIAWLMAHEWDVVPIPGSRKPHYVIDNAAAADVDLSVAQVARLNEAFPPGAAKGSSEPQMPSGGR